MYLERNELARSPFPRNIGFESIRDIFQAISMKPCLVKELKIANYLSLTFWSTLLLHFETWKQENHTSDASGSNLQSLVSSTVLLLIAQTCAISTH